MGNISSVFLLCDSSADEKDGVHREDVVLVSVRANASSYQPPADESAKVAPANGGGAESIHAQTMTAGEHHEEKPQKGSKGVKLMVEDVEADDDEKAQKGSKGVKLMFFEDFPADEEYEDRQAKKEAFQNASGSTARPSMFRKCPTFIDPHKGLRTGKTVMLSSGNVLDAYENLGKLGEGGFGCVYKVRHKDTKQLFALKSIPTDNVSDPDTFERELDISKKLNHPYIIRLHQTFNDPEAYHLIMDLCTGGDLFEHILSTVVNFGGKTCGGMKDQDVGRTMWMILNGVAYMHNYKFAHRDIKPENFLLPEKNSKSGVKLIDFGLGRSFERGVKMTSKVGTVAYVAPEVIFSEDGYDERCDIWSIGVLCFVMACAEMPFQGKDDAETLEHIKKNKPSFDGQDWRQHSADVKKLATDLMTSDPAKRLSAKDLLMTNPFVMKHAVGASAEKGSCCAVQ